VIERSQLRLLALAIRTNNGAANLVRGAVRFRMDPCGAETAAPLVFLVNPR